MNNKWPWSNVRIRIHFLFWVVILSAVVTGRFLEIITLFVLVIIHEMGHITAAWSFGWRVESLELLPFGGVAKTDEWGTVSTQEELIVALAGPFHNVMMILVGFIFYYASWWSAEWTSYFIYCNALIAGFNLLPIYPLDGGRVFQGVLSYYLPYRKSIVYSILIGFALSVALLGVSVMIGGIHLNLLVIALFLGLSNWMAYRQKDFQFIRHLMHRYNCRRSKRTPLVWVDVKQDEKLLSVVKRWKKEGYHCMRITDGDDPGKVTIPEEVLLTHYFQEKNPRATMKDLIFLR
ncbi:M50 family metallopeptidase [Mechercharimyces sp. CAU 1602]|uniref:M50 family metallopeptidase n=1 Tax=Mechercharimyces sp. CAU 1602 TaxID=2973933 RepID=UPI002163EAD7|nr:M50 family metallopeptidase [Mechercharimyces sp. CAU 1602]MCS1351431.1 M50 family metallopeptidase [Mechercharimyces sp. CAU 1602]